MNNCHSLWQYFWKRQPDWYKPQMFSGSPTLGCLISEIKWVGKLRPFSENVI